MKVHIYNPLHDITVKFDGREFVIPQGDSTLDDYTATAPDVYKRNAPSATSEDKKAMREQTIKGEHLATYLLRRQYMDYFAAGFIVSEKPIVKEDVKKAADMKCQQWKVRQIDEAMQEREERRAGGKGRLTFDDQMIEWMVQLGIEDKLYNPKPSSAFSEDQLAAIGTVAATAAVKALDAVTSKK